MNQNCIEVIAKEFCGDFEDSLYSYKSGYQLIDFFNSNYEFNDQYYSGFPTRWIYVSDKIKELEKRNLLNNFFSLILSAEFHINEKKITTMEAISLIEELKKSWNTKLRPYKFQLININNKYELTNFDEDLELIGEGGFAKVYLRKSSNLVIKFLKRENLSRESDKKRFKREYEITKSISSLPGIIKVFGFNELEYFYTMEKCDYNLKSFLLENTENTINLEKKESIILEVLNIISNIHQKDIIHRDLSPNNIFLKGNKIKVGDFGLGKDFNSIHSYQTTSTAQLGQIEYCSPEQYSKLNSADKFSDVYSLGKLINFIMTKNPNNKNHKYKSLVEKATSPIKTNRYKDAGLMRNNFIKFKDILLTKNNIKIINEKINKGVYDEFVAKYISSLNSHDICHNIINMHGFIKILYLYFDKNNESILEILNYIYLDMDNSCKKFEDADCFADISYYILNNNLGTFEVKEKAAEILNHVSYDINRFYAQRKIKSLMKQGIEPMLENILSQK